MARRKRVIKKLRRAEVAAHRVAMQPLLRHHRRTTGVNIQMATGRGATSWSANAVGVLVEVLGADTCEQPSRLPKRGVRILATLSKHYLCWQKRIWWRMVPSGAENPGGFDAVRPSGRRASGVRFGPQFSFSTAKLPREKAPRGARVGRTGRQSNPCSPNVCIAPCGATAAHRGCDVGVAGAEALDADAARYRAALAVSYLCLI